MTTPPRTVLCYGDSNTHGSLPMATLDDLRRLGPAERWPGVIAAILGPSWRVFEEGLPGRTTVHPDPIEGGHLSGLAALPMVLGTHSPIDVLVIMLGTNDLKARCGVGATDIPASVEVLVRTARAFCAGSGRPVPEVLVVSPAPITEGAELGGTMAGGAAKSRALGPLLRDVAARLGTGFLDAGEHVEV